MTISKNDQKHVVFSNGFALSSVDVSEVAAKLGALYKMPAKEISKRLLSGNERKIKSFDDVKEAERLAAKLTSAGLNCYVLSPETEAQIDDYEHLTNDTIGENETDKNSQSADASGSAPLDSSINSIAESEVSSVDTQVKPNKALKWVILLMILLSIIAVAYYSLAKWLMPEVPTSVGKVEAAIFVSQRPSALIHGDVSQMRRLLSLAGDADLEAKSTSALSKIPLMNSATDANLLLVAADYVTASATFSNNDKSQANWLTVLQGDYAGLHLENELSSRYEIEKTDSGVLILRHKSQAPVADSDIVCPADKDETSAAPQSPTYAHWSDTQIVFSSTSENLGSFLLAYGGIAALEQQELREWQGYRKQSLFAMSLFDKRLLQQDFISNAASSALLGDTGYKSIGARASISAIKQALEISFDADVNNTSVANELASKVNNGIAELSITNKQSFPAVVDLLSRIGVVSDHALHITLSLDKGLVNELETLVSDFFSMLFSPNMSQSEPTSDTPRAEALEKDLWDHTLNNKLLLKSKPPVDQFTKFHPIATQDGTAIFLDSIGIKPISPFDTALGSALQITLKAKRTAPFGDAFFGWSNSGIKQSLSITSVLDNAGDSLLIDERCLKPSFNQNLNHQASDTSHYSNEVIETIKTVRLLPSASVEKISTIKGNYALDVPVNVITEDVSLNLPLVEWQTGSFELSDIDNGSVTYTLAGDATALLEVRGLNDSGQALSSSSSFSIGKRHTKQFQGKVAFVQLIIATDFKRREFDFNINDIIPKPAVGNETGAADKLTIKPILFNKADTPKFAKGLSLNKLSTQEAKELSRRLNWQNYSLDATQSHELGHTSTVSGAIFFKHDEKSNWGHKLTGLVLMPFDKALHHGDGLVTLDLTLDGETTDPVNLSMSKSTVNNKPAPVFSVGTRDYDYATFRIPFAEQRNRISTVKGVLEYKLPTKTSITTVDLLDQSNKNNGLIFLGYDFGGHGRVSYQLSDELAAAFFIKLSSGDDLENVGIVSVDGEGVTTVMFNQVAKPRKIEFHFIQEAHSITEEFEFVPVYK